MMDFILNVLIPAVDLTGRAYELLILASVIMSWIRPDPYNPIVRFIRSMTEPLFELVRRTLPFLRAGMIDFSPIVVLLLVNLARSLVISLLRSIALQM